MKQNNRKIIERELELMITDLMGQAELSAAEESAIMSISHPHPEKIYELLVENSCREIERKYVGVKY